MTTDTTEQRRALREAALHFHEFPKPGKLEIQATKPLGNQRDLALAYSPGVAAPCEEIAANPDLVTNYTSRGNLVAVISNGTAVLGLGAIGEGCADQRDLVHRARRRPTACAAATAAISVSAALN